ncbi:MAG: pitrilysin family protein [Bacteroidota bacterium]
MPTTTLNRTKAPRKKNTELSGLLIPELHKLDNGIPVYIINGGTQDVMRLEFVFKAGSACQRHPLESWFAVKMLNDGTENYTAEQISGLLEYYGAYIGAIPQKDNVTVSLSLLSKHLEKVFPILEEVIKKPVFPEKEFNILIEQSRQKYIDDQQRVSEIAAQKFNRAIFGEHHPYGKILNLEDFSLFNREWLHQFHRAKYSYDNVCIVVAGKIPENCFKLLNQYFGKDGWNKNSVEPVASNFDIQTVPGKYLFPKEDVFQSAIRIGKATVTMTHPDFPKLQLLNTVFGGYFGSRLMSNIREDKGYTYGIYSALVNMNMAGLFFITSEVAADSTTRALDEVYKELKKLRSTDIPKAELSLVRNYMTGHLQRTLDGPFYTADRFKSVLDAGLDFKDYIANYVKIISETGKDELKSLASAYFDESTMTEVVAGKKNQT